MAVSTNWDTPRLPRGQDWGRCVGRGAREPPRGCGEPPADLALGDLAGLRHSALEAGPERSRRVQRGLSDSGGRQQAERTALVCDICRLRGR